MAEDLVFPRLIYRGEADTLGSGVVGETARCESASDFDARQKEGWRLTREIPDEGEKPAAAAKKK